MLVIILLLKKIIKITYKYVIHYIKYITLNTIITIVPSSRLWNGILIFINYPIG